MKKRIFMVLMVLAVMVAPMFAGSVTIGSESGGTVDSIAKIVTLCTGTIPGAVIAIKFMLDIVKAYMHREQDPQGFQKAIINFVIVVIIVIGYVVLVNYIFKTDANEATTGNGGTGGRSEFLQGLTGAEISPAFAAFADAEETDSLVVYTE